MFPAQLHNLLKEKIPFHKMYQSESWFYMLTAIKNKHRACLQVKINLSSTGNKLLPSCSTIVTVLIFEKLLLLKVHFHFMF